MTGHLALFAALSADTPISEDGWRAASLFDDTESETAVFYVRGPTPRHPRETAMPKPGPKELQIRAMQEQNAKNHPKPAARAAVLKRLAAEIADQASKPKGSTEPQEKPTMNTRAKKKAATKKKAKKPTAKKKAPAKATRKTARAAPSSPASAPAAKPGTKARYDWKAISEAASAGKLPPEPDFTAACNAPYRERLAEITALAKAGDVKGLRAMEIPDYNSIVRTLARYRDLAVTALTAGG